MLTLLIVALAHVAFAALALVQAVFSMAEGVTEGASVPSLLDTVSWGLIAGVLTPVLTSFFQQGTWSKTMRTLVGLGVSIAVGLLTCLANGTLDTNPQFVLTTIAAVLVASSATFKSIWRPSGVTDAIESATSPKSMRSDPPRE